MVFFLNDNRKKSVKFWVHQQGNFITPSTKSLSFNQVQLSTVIFFNVIDPNSRCDAVVVNCPHPVYKYRPLKLSALLFDLRKILLPLTTVIHWWHTGNRLIWLNWQNKTAKLSRADFKLKLTEEGWQQWRLVLFNQHLIQPYS